MTRWNPLTRAAATAAAVAGACLLALPASALAAAANPEAVPLNLGSGQSSHTSASTGGASITRTIVGLAVVLAVIWGLTWVLRQVKSGREPRASSEGLASIAALTLGSGRSVHLVRAGSEYVLLGSAEHGVVPIHRYSEEEALEAGLVPIEEAGPRPRGRAYAPAPAVDPAAGGMVDRLRGWTVRR